MNPDILHLFAGVWDLLEVPLEAAVQESVNSLSEYVKGPFRAWVLVYFIATTAIAMYGDGEAAVSQFFKNMLRAATIYMIISNAEAFNYFVSAPLLHGIPDGITKALSRASGQQFGPDTFDRLLVRSFTVGVEVYNAVPWMSLKGIALSLGVLLYWAVAFAAIGFTFTIYLLSHAAASVLVSIGVIFVALRMFPVTASLFSGWLSVTLSAILVQILSVVLLTIIIRMEETRMDLVTAIGTAGGTNGDNVVAYMMILLGMMLIFSIGLCLAYKISGSASAMTHGMYWAFEHSVGAQMGQMASWVGGKLGAGAALAAKAAQTASNSASNRTFSFQRPPGRAP